jgi:monoamine oxidase
MTRVAIIGAGPGGLFTADFIARKYGDACDITIFEASDRPGGKLRTRTFTTAPVPYESGAAEIYDYSGCGRDPFRTMIEDLGFATRPMLGQTVVLDGTILRNDADIVRHWGTDALEEIDAFRRRVARLLPRERWHPGSWEYDAAHPWSHRTCAELLDTVRNPVARRYLTVSVHSDLATEPHLTSGLNGIKNFVMDVPGYIGFYSIQGGMSALAGVLVSRTRNCTIETGTRVVGLLREGNAWRVAHTCGGRTETTEFDAVIVALPAGQLGRIHYEGDVLRRAMADHLARFDRPGHYLRVSLLFRSPFWHDLLDGSWFMLDAFGGACVYDESARLDADGHGVLGVLIAGNDALDLINADDTALARGVIDSLPGRLRERASRRFLEARVHRWCSGVSGQPGGLPIHDPVTTHQADADRLPGLLLVGDYLFDSTLNGVYRSADLTTTLLASHLPAGVGEERAPWT